jgi:hypothetical protein
VERFLVADGIPLCEWLEFPDTGIVDEKYHCLYLEEVAGRNLTQLKELRPEVEFKAVKGTCPNHTGEKGYG